MDNEKINPIEIFHSFDLGELGGGKQLIIDYRAISPVEYYVMTLGNGPKTDLTPDFDIKKLEENYLKNQEIVKNEENKNIKIRFFKLSLREDNKYLVEEYVSIKTITEVAKLFI